jgi:hypothetical protein
MSVMKSIHPELELIRMPNKSLEIRNGVTMRIHTNLPPQYSAERFPSELLRKVTIHFLHTNSIGSRTPIFLGPDIIPRLLESVAEFPSLT